MSRTFNGGDAFLVMIRANEYHIRGRHVSSCVTLWVASTCVTARELYHLSETACLLLQWIDGAMTAACEGCGSPSTTGVTHVERFNLSTFRSHCCCRDAYSSLHGSQDSLVVKATGRFMILNPVVLKIRRIGKRCMLNLSKLKPPGVEVRIGMPAEVSSPSRDHGSKFRGPSPKVLE
ncbi:hypothetical protein TNCV_853881 [Trichonephila clavipes]|nr:hypothetical protein TNCV_853881 [Trichonephila clavipes]